MVQSARFVVAGLMVFLLSFQAVAEVCADPFADKPSTFYMVQRIDQTQAKPGYIARIVNNPNDFSGVRTVNAGCVGQRPDNLGVGINIQSAKGCYWSISDVHLSTWDTVEVNNTADGSWIADIETTVKNLHIGPGQALLTRYRIIDPSSNLVAFVPVSANLPQQFTLHGTDPALTVLATVAKTYTADAATWTVQVTDGAQADLLRQVIPYITTIKDNETPSCPPEPNPPTPEPTNWTAAIVGSVIGGAVVVTGVVLTVWCLARRGFFKKSADQGRLLDDK